MSPFIQSLLLFALILLAAKTASYLSTLAPQLFVLGELPVGLLVAVLGKLVGVGWGSAWRAFRAWRLPCFEAG